MNFFEIIKFLFPYLHSIRKLKDYVSIDLVFPKGWEFPNEYIEKVQVVQNDKHVGEGTFLSFVCSLNETMDHTLPVIFELINHNLEREEKERLLKQKVVELKQMFQNHTLDDLKNLIIDLKSNELSVENLLNDDEEN